MGNHAQNETSSKKSVKSLADQVYRGAEHGQRHGVQGSLEDGWVAESAAHAARKLDAEQKGSKFSN